MRLKAATLPETLVSFAVLALLLGISFQVAGQLRGFFSPAQQYQSRVILRECLYSPMPPEVLYKEVEKKGRRVELRWCPLSRSGGLWLVEGTCYYQSQPLERQSRIFILDSILDFP